MSPTIEGPNNVGWHPTTLLLLPSGSLGSSIAKERVRGEGFATWSRFLHSDLTIRILRFRGCFDPVLANPVSLDSSFRRDTCSRLV